MRLAIEWAWRGRGWTSPRPCVGALLVNGGEIIGAGCTARGGAPHAEVMALQAAHEVGLDTTGATAYVTLEPCSHFGKTPPCCDALIAAGISRAVVGLRDPNPLVAGRGLARMRAAGVEVVVGTLEAECARAQEDFLHSIVHKTPFVTLKSAVSLDGKIALPNGQSKWITGAKSRERAHLMRHQNDAVLVGIETVLADNPTLDVRLEGEWKQPARVVLDSRGRLPLGAKIWDRAPQLIVATSRAEPKNLENLRENGATVLQIEADARGQILWPALLKQLFALGLTSVLIEGGARVAGSAIRAGAVQKVAFFVAPLLMGAGKSALSGFEIEDLALAPRLKEPRVEVLGDDVLVEGYL